MSFIWKNKKPRVPFRVLKQKKTHGGMAVPDIQHYYNSVVLSRMAEWAKRENEKHWVRIEEFLCKAPLGSMIWNPPQARIFDKDTHVITHNVFKIWDRVYKKVIGNYNSPLISLVDNNFFPPGLESIGGKDALWGKTQLRHIIRGGKIMTLHEIRAGKETRGLDGWRYLQLCHFVSGLPGPIRAGNKLTELERLCDTEDQRNIVSKMYKVLMKVDQLEIPPYIDKWERELGTKKDANTIKRILDMICNSARDAHTAEMNYKCISNLTPEIVCKYQNKTAYCWRGCQEIGTMSHLWWTCPKIKTFWGEICGLIKEITGKVIADDPWEVLFHGGDGDIKKYKQSLVPHLLNAAKRIIPKNWQRKESPEIWEWIDAVEETYMLENRAHAIEGKGALLDH